jgi:hypothetical protein
MSDLNLLEKFTKYDLQEVDSVITRLNNSCKVITDISKKYQIHTNRDLASLQKYGDPEDVKAFLIAMRELKALQTEIEFLFIEGD